MKTNSASTANDIGNTQDHPQTQKLEEKSRPYKRSISRRSFLGKSLAVGAGTVGAGFFINTRTARASGGPTPGDAALLRFPAALEILEADFWIQYNELAGIQQGSTLLLSNKVAIASIPRWRKGRHMRKSYAS